MKTWLENIDAKCPNNKLAHYTSFEVLRSILDKKEIWCTNIHRQNDETEFSYGFGVLAECMYGFFEEAHDKQKASQFINLVRETIPRFQWRHIHTVSFSTEENLLSQWRGYAPKGGVSIVFDYKHLKLLSEQNGHKLFKCIYDKEKQLKIAKEVVHSNTTHGNKLIEASGDYELLKLAEELVDHFAFFSPFMKHPSFKEEQEWRMMISGTKGIPYPHAQVEFRPVSNTLKPIYKLSLLKKQTKPGQKHEIGINQVIVGPTRHADLVADAVDGLFDELNVSARELSMGSGIPYRAD